MIVRRFLAWTQTASAAQRAEGASALARAMLYSGLPEADARDAEVALTAMLDDPSPMVRRSLAESFASAARAPYPMIVALANDQSDISAIVLSRSPVLTDADLIDCAAIGDGFAQSAIALRPDLSAPVAAALAEIGGREALISLAVNDGADIPDFSIRRMIERLGDDGELREALLARRDLSGAIRHDLVDATARALSEFVTRCAWMPSERVHRVAREARDKGTIMIAAGDDDGVAALVTHLRARGHLTSSLLLRAVLTGNRALFAAALAELAGLPLERTAALMRAPQGSGFAALYARAGLPKLLLTAFRAALSGNRDLADRQPTQDARLSPALIASVLDACQTVAGDEAARLMALLRRFESEAARERARDLAQVLQMPEPTSPVVRASDYEASGHDREDLLQVAA